MAIELTCPSCGGRLQAGLEHAGKRVGCPHCQSAIQVPAMAAPLDQPGPAPSEELPSFGLTPDTDQQAGEEEENPFAGIGEPTSYAERARAAAAERSDGGGAMGWIIFILIFGVGNLILYSTTGWFIIPIPRR